MKVVTLALVLLPLAAGAETYKWKDASGGLHYTQTPPRSGHYETLGSPPPPPSPTAPAADPANPAAPPDTRAEPARQPAPDPAPAAEAQRQETCRAALERIGYLDAHTPRRLVTTDANGNSARMTQEEFDRQRAAEQQRADQNC